MKKIILHAHSYAGNTIEALHLVQDELLRVDGVMTFNIMADLILIITGAYGK